jgi:aldehyde dehydrogenase (NAD+)
MSASTAAKTASAVLDRLGIAAVNPGAGTGHWLETRGAELASVNPATGEPIAAVRLAGPADYDAVVTEAQRAFEKWRLVPAPKRGEVVRALGDALRAAKDDLGRLVSLENGKILSEGLGEVQEMIDICDFVVGLSRQLYGLSMHSERLLADRRVPLISATGSCRMGKHIAEVVAPRFGRTILELGGNNAITVLDDADLDLAVRAVTFAAVGTAGQRCTTLRRLIVQKGVAGELVARLKKVFGSIRIGDPLEADTLMGPLIDAGAVETMMKALDEVRAEGGEVLCGGKRLDRPGNFVEPTLVRARADMRIVQEETFAPILYVIEVADVDEAIRVNNGVPQGLSSAIFTRNLLAAERFLSAAGSDCGIANVNIGTSGAEIGGAFGGEKETGGGREAGSDSWKLYMRRQTVTVNYGKDLPLAQGVKFDV